MKSYAVSRGIITDAAIADLGFVTELLEKLPNRSELEREGALPASRHTEGHWSCHVMTRIAAEMTKLDWKVADGFFLKRGNRHSWLWCRVGGTALILDVLPIAGSRPMLVDGGPRSPWFDAYIESASYHPMEELKAWDEEATTFLALFADGFDEWRRLQSA